MSILKKNRYFLNFLIECRSDKQRKELLKHISPDQQLLLKKFAQQIVQGKIEITNLQYKKLLPKKKFILSLSQRKVSKNNLCKNFKTILDIVHIILHNETSSKIGTNTNRRLGKNKKQKHERSKGSGNKNYKSTSHKYMSRGKIYKQKGKKNRTDEEEEETEESDWKNSEDSMSSYSSEEEEEYQSFERYSGEEDEEEEEDDKWEKEDNKEKEDVATSSESS